ncbi:MAG TPA: serine/threonine-protein kinase [Acidimicrobiales bacterium]|jgi:serine/threonine-protein kinase|nr:serine/threonine-protein kinase [Acidimicrobiales bacterium]
MSRYQPGDRLDRYAIAELLGAGAYNESYKATDTRTGRTVVLKVPDPNLFADPATYNRYKRESEVARKLDHPSVQGAVDDGEKRSEPYLVLSYVEGDSLSQRLHRQRGAFPIPTVVEWGRQLAGALAYLHGQGVVHRDLKPGNVLIGPGERLVVADFGTAQLAGARRLTFKHLTGKLGTPDYMSPEQAQGGRGDARSDIYAWGVMMYEMLTGKVPFPGDNWMAVMAGHLQGTPKPIRQLRPDVPPGLEAVVLHAMRRYPENRYASAEELLADLGRYQSLDGRTYDLAPEKPMGSLMAGGGGKGLLSKVFKNRGGG